MSVATTIFLLRHAAHDSLYQLCGRLPGVVLGATGLLQASALAARLRPQRIAAVYTSPMERCRQTAEAIDPDARCCDGLDEIDFGAWSGRYFAELQHDPDWRAWNVARDTARPPDGESMRAAQGRICAAVGRIRQRHAGGRIALVSHADLIRAVLLDILGLPLQAYERFDIAPASISIVAVWDGGGKVIGMNDVAHLQQVVPA